MAEMAGGLGLPVTPPKPSMHEVGSTSKSSSMPKTRNGIEDSTSSVHDSLVIGLDFSPGLDFARKARSDFHTTVHPTRNSSHFTMVVSFGRSIFRLSEDNVSLALESVTGGLCDELKVSILRDRVFSFTVSCRQIGFMILQRRSFACDQFKCYFHLWGRGGPNWGCEFHLWQQECQQEWILVSPSKRTIQMGFNAICAAGKMKSSIRSGSAVQKKLQFATIVNYPACQGYRYPATAEEIQDLQQGGYILSDAEKVPVTPAPEVHWTNTEPSIPFSTSARSNNLKFAESIQHEARKGYSSNISFGATATPSVTLGTTVPINSLLSQEKSDNVEQVSCLNPNAEANTPSDSEDEAHEPTGLEEVVDDIFTRCTGEALARRLTKQQPQREPWIRSPLMQNPHHQRSDRGGQKPVSSSMSCRLLRSPDVELKPSSSDTQREARLASPSLAAQPLLPPPLLQPLMQTQKHVPATYGALADLAQDGAHAALHDAEAADAALFELAPDDVHPAHVLDSHNVDVDKYGVADDKTEANNMHVALIYAAYIQDTWSSNYNSSSKFLLVLFLC
ncbi:hypothetical protein ACQ4PT_028241 [Festuca glaucescens]